MDEWTTVSSSFKLIIALYCHNVHVTKPHAPGEQNGTIVQSLSSDVQHNS